MEHRDLEHPGTSSPPAESADRLNDRAVFREQLEYACARAAGEREGLFGPGSMSWKISRETMLFAGGGRALLLQFAHPSVAAGVAQHSRFRDDLIGRSRRTFKPVYEIVFGDLSTARRAAEAIHYTHLAVRGTVESDTSSPVAGTRYRANDPALLFWVYATLIDTSLQAFELLVQPLWDTERSRFYEECLLAAAMFGIPPSAIPSTYAQFDTYFRDMLEGPLLQVGEPARRLFHSLFGPLPMLGGLNQQYLLLTAGLLPARFRGAFGLPWGEVEQRRFVRLTGVLRRSLAGLPPALRFVPAYRRAVVRLGGARDEGRQVLPHGLQAMARMMVGWSIELFLRQALRGRIQA